VFTGNNVSGANLGSATFTGINIAVATGTHDKITGNSATDTLTAAGSSDTLVAGTGGGTLIASGSGDFMSFGTTAGSVAIINGTSANTTASNELDFGSGLTDEKLWLKQSGNNLVIELLGTSTAVTVRGWFAHTYNQLGSITAGGLTLDTKVSQLVQAMATYQTAHPTFDPTTATTMPTDTTLQNAIAADWHS